MSESRLPTPEISPPSWSQKYSFYFAIVAASLGIVFFLYLLGHLFLSSYEKGSGTVLSIYLLRTFRPGTDLSAAGFIPKVRYRYKVGNTEYHSDVVVVNQVSSVMNGQLTAKIGSEYWANQIISKYTESDHVSISYDPVYPSQAFLTAENSLSFPYLPLMAFIGASLLSLCLWVQERKASQ